MAINDNITNLTRYDRDSSSYRSEAQLYTRLNELRHNLTSGYFNYEKEAEKELFNTRLDYYQEEFDKKLKGAKDLVKAQQKIELTKDRLLARAKKKLDDKEYKEYEKRLEKRYQKSLEYEKKLAQYREKLDEAREKRETYEKAVSEATEGIFGKGKSLSERWNSLKLAGPGGLIGALASLAKALDSSIDEIASYQSKFNARLQGSGKRWEGRGGLSQTITGIAGVSPLVRQDKIVDNLGSLIDKGISYNVEQRAFLQTISEKIATTFDAANGTLLQLIRVQQSDTTAARLGMEATLTRYLNSMFQTTEYLSDLSKSVTQSLYEATSTMSSSRSIGFEYQVQKWLGSLYSVGMSSSGIEAISSALGMLGSGNISGLAGNSAMQNLLVMAASRGGLSYAELLTKGLDESNVNTLLQNIVGYLAEIAEGNNNVVKSQYASIFGMSLSDLRSISNILPSVSTIAKTSLNYSGAIQELYNQTNQLYSRLSLGEMMSNIWENTKYSMAAGVASNPALYAIWKAAGLLDDTMGGIQFSLPLYMGTGTAQTFKVADLMRVGALSGGIFSSMASMIGAGGGGIIPSNMLKALGINASTVSVLSRGKGLGTLSGGESVSRSAYVGNASGEDIMGSTMAGVEQEQANKVEAKKEEEESTTLDTLDNHISDIYELLLSVISGGTLKVTVDSYGLTGGLNP